MNYREELKQAYQNPGASLPTERWFEKMLTGEVSHSDILDLLAERDSLAVELTRRNAEVERLTAYIQRIKNTGSHYLNALEDTLDSIWQILYPGRDHWAYPAQVFKQIGKEIERLREYRNE